MLVYYKTCQFLINGKLKSDLIFICGRALLFFNLCLKDCSFNAFFPFKQLLYYYSTCFREDCSTGAQQCWISLGRRRRSVWRLQPAGIQQNTAAAAAARRYSTLFFCFVNRCSLHLLSGPDLRCQHCEKDASRYDPPSE